MKKKIVYDEIDLTEIAITIWQNKFKVILITLISFSLTLAHSFYKKKIFVATTEIEPISIFEQNLYGSYNVILNDIKNTTTSNNKFNNETEKLNKNITTNEDLASEFKFNLINKKILQELFLAKIQDNKVIGEAINKFQLINKKNFESEELYNLAVEKLAFELKILNPINIDGKKKRCCKKKLEYSI